MNSLQTILSAITFFSVLTVSAQNYDLQVVTEFDLGHKLGQFRAVSISLGENQPKAIAAMYSEDAEIDPYIGMFFFPSHTLKSDGF